MSDDDRCVNCGHADEKHDDLGLCTECSCVHYAGQDEEPGELDFNHEEED